MKQKKINITEQEIIRLLKEYDIGSYVSHTHLKKGVMNYNFKLKTTKGLFSLKIYDKRNISQIDFEISLLQKLYFTVAHQPIKGKTFRTTIQSKQCVIFSYIGGNHKYKLQKNDLISVGKEIAKIHMVTQNVKPKVLLKKYSYSKDWVFEMLEELQEKHPNFPKDIREQITTSLKRITVPSLRRGVVHGDLHEENLIFNTKDKLVGIIDFDDCNITNLLIDLGCCASYFCIDSKKGILFPKIRFLLQGYESIRPLTQAEKKYLYDHIIVFTVIHYVYHLYDTSNWVKNIRTKRRLTHLEKITRNEFNTKLYQNDTRSR